MPPAEAFAYPLLLAAIYGIYRVGRPRGLPRVTPFEWTRLGLLAVGLVFVALLQVRVAASGQLPSPWNVLVGVLSVAAVLALFGIHAVDVGETWRRARAS